MDSPHPLPVVWTARAAHELEAIGDYIAIFNPLAAQRLAVKLIAAAEALESYPGRFKTVGAAREMVAARPYIIRYRVETDRVLVLRVRHGARRR
jgi:toxin ParE1/3/4